MADIFVSYKAEDRRRVATLVEALEADGLSVWWDEQIDCGAAWRQKIEAELNSAKCVIVVWSKRSTGPEGGFVQDEANRAQERHVYLPVRIDKARVPLGFGETQATSLAGWTGDRSDPHYQAVLGSARAIVSGIARPSHPHIHRPKYERRTVIAGGGVAALAAAVGGWFLLKPGSAQAANSVAVLPFANLSGDPAQAYFSDGLAEELRTALSRIPELKVMARTSSEKVRDDDIETAARKLDVANILTGSVRRSPSTIRISTQLIDGRDGLERWSEAYDRPVGDTLRIQIDIAQKVATALSIRLVGNSRKTLALGGTNNPAAQDLLLQVTGDRDPGNRAAFERNLALLDEALKLDPNYAEAHARKGYLMMVKAGTYSSSAKQADLGHAQALASADRAIAIAPRMALGHAIRGNILRQRLEMRSALASAERANSLPGDDVGVIIVYSLLLAQIGRSAEALRLSARIISLDPLSPVSHETHAVNLYIARRYAEAAANARRSLEIGPSGERARAYLGHSLLAQAKAAEAATEYRKLEPTDYRRLLGQAIIAARAGQRPVAFENLRQMQRLHGDSALYQFGEIYAQLGLPDEAFKQLELAFEARDSGMSGFRVDPFLDPIRKDPRFASLERKLDFP
jgi:serine/threonine-protein kinase